MDAKSVSAYCADLGVDPQTVIRHEAVSLKAVLAKTAYLLTKEDNFAGGVSTHDRASKSRANYPDKADHLRAVEKQNLLHVLEEAYGLCC